MNDLVPDDDGAVWIDYVSDLGDGLMLPMQSLCFSPSEI
jgi:hypothetical protein